MADNIEFGEKAKLLMDSPMLFGLDYCDVHFRLLPPPGFHVKISDEAVKCRRLAVQAPRQSAKSTILTFLHVLHGICHAKYHFIVIVQNTYAKAAASLDGIKSEIKANERLKKDYPLEVVKDAEGDSIFKYKGSRWECRVLCKGADQIGSVRGEKFGAWRPDLIIIDDLEDDELVRNSERRKKLQEDFDNALIPAGDVEKLKVIAVGTILHDDCLMARLVGKEFYPEYRKLFYRARVEKSGVKSSLWTQQWTVEALDEIEKMKPEVFAKEYQGDPSSGIYQDFVRSDFRYWRMEEGKAVLLGENNEIIHRWDLRDCRAAVACDLAWETKRASDNSVILPAYLTPSNDILYEDYISKKGMRPDEIEESLFAINDRLSFQTGGGVPIGFEKAKLEKVVKWLLGQAMRRRNKYLWLKDLVWDGDKITRIVSRLSNRYRQHTVYHKRGMGELEGQLLRIRSTAHDDIADAAQGVVQLLNYPKATRKETPEEDQFMKLRKFAISSNKPDKGTYHFGNKTHHKVPSTACPI